MNKTCKALEECQATGNHLIVITCAVYSWRIKWDDQKNTYQFYYSESSY